MAHCTSGAIRGSVPCSRTLRQGIELATFWLLNDFSTSCTTVYWSSPHFVREIHKSMWMFRFYEICSLYLEIYCTCRPVDNSSAHPYRNNKALAVWKNTPTMYEKLEAWNPKVAHYFGAFIPAPYCAVSSGERATLVPRTVAKDIPNTGPLPFGLHWRKPINREVVCRHLSTSPRRKRASFLCAARQKVKQYCPLGKSLATGTTGSQEREGYFIIM